MKRYPLPANPADRVPHRAAQIREATERGLNPAQIAQELGITRGRVLTIASWHGIDVHNGGRGQRVARLDHVRAVSGVVASITRVADTVSFAPLDYTKLTTQQANACHRDVVNALKVLHAFRDALKNRTHTP